MTTVSLHVTRRIERMPPIPDLWELEDLLLLKPDEIEILRMLLFKKLNFVDDYVEYMKIGMQYEMKKEEQEGKNKKAF